MNVSTDVANLLIYLFMGIFAMTAALTLISLPGWIKIEEWYRKKLFNALILEVIGSVILLFTYIVEKKDSGGVDIQKNQVVIEKDSRFLPSWNKSGDMDINMNDTALTVGKIMSKDIAVLGLFNNINTSTVDSKDYALLDFRKQASGWANKGGMVEGCPFEFEIYSNAAKGRLCYRIREAGTDKVLVDTAKGSKSDDFAIDNRIHHVLKHENTDTGDMDYYLYRITDADLQTRMYVQVLLLKIKPTLEKV